MGISLVAVPAIVRYMPVPLLRRLKVRVNYARMKK